MTMDDMTRQTEHADIEAALRLQPPPSPTLPRTFRAQLDQRLSATDRFAAPAPARTHRAYAAAIAAAALLAALLSVALRTPRAASDPVPADRVAMEQPANADATNDAAQDRVAERAHFLPARLLAATSTTRFTAPAPLQVEATRLVADLRQFAQRLPGRTISVGARATEG